MAEPTPVYAGWFRSMRLRHPTEDRELELRLESEEAGKVDAVFITVNAVERVLIPFYEQVEKDKEKAGQVAEEVEQHKKDGIVIVFHKRMTGFWVPAIDWSSRGPIRL